MSGDWKFLFGLVDTPLVRHGVDERLPDGGHTFQPVYTEMLLQISRDYAGLPDPRTLKIHEIRFFYEGLRAEIKEHTKPR